MLPWKPLLWTHECCPGAVVGLLFSAVGRCSPRGFSLSLVNLRWIWQQQEIKLKEPSSTKVKTWRSHGLILLFSAPSCIRFWMRLWMRGVRYTQTTLAWPRCPLGAGESEINKTRFLPSWWGLEMLKILVFPAPLCKNSYNKNGCYLLSGY